MSQGKNQNQAAPGRPTSIPIPEDKAIYGYIPWHLQTDVHASPETKKYLQSQHKFNVNSKTYQPQGKKSGNPAALNSFQEKPKKVQNQQPKMSNQEQKY